MFSNIIAFLNRSKIHYAISANEPIYFCIIRYFWNMTKLVQYENHIKAADKKVVIDVSLIRNLLRFLDTDDDRCEFEKDIIRGLFGRLKLKAI